MFYSQFILAKKGPLGTIWIAAHLERKLRKNQVADTDIGVSVDSILFPDVPIALRLSSHLLLGVVRIYSRKVNYLFDDCSEALLKVKQAFRSAAVDLPPEQSKAPYHSITLPETFDLDDFELPDNEILQGNYVDHHVSTRDQITLQDTMDGVAFPTSQFGPDERFGDGDASQIGLDLDEDLLLDKGGDAGTSGVLMDTDTVAQASIKGSSPFKGDDHNEGVSDPSVAANYFGIQAPSTPGLMEEPYLPSAQEALVSDEHMDEEHNHHQDEHAKLPNVSTVDFPVDGIYHNEDEQNKARSMNTAELSTTDNNQPLTSIDLVDGIHGVSGLDSAENNVNCRSLEHEGNLAADIQFTGNTEVVEVRANTLPENTSVTELPNVGGDTADLVNDAKSENDKSSVGSGDPRNRETDELGLSTRHESENAGQPGLQSENFETIVSYKDNNLSDPSMPVLQACNSHLHHACNGFDSSVGVNVPAEENGRCSVRTSGIEDPAKVTGISKEVQDECHGTDVMKPTLTADQITPEVTYGDNGYIDGKVVNVTPGQVGVGKEDNSKIADFPAPEKLLSVPNHPNSHSNDFFMECTPAKGDLAVGDGDATLEKIVSGRKRSYTESTLTIQSLNSTESSGAAQSKRSVEFIPDDDDLLSSILVGKKSTAFKVKPTPPAADTVPAKRQRVALRASSHKRKVLVDDATVLHGDTIRQQLTNTEDIRRVRKKAPCTRREIWMLQKQFLEDEIFSESVFTGMSTALISLHCETFDLSRTRIVPNAVNKKAKEMETSTGPTPGEEAENAGTLATSVTKDNSDQEPVGSLDTPGQLGSVLGADVSSLQKEIDNEITKEPSDNHASGGCIELEVDGRIPIGGEDMGVGQASLPGPISDVNCNSTADMIIDLSCPNETDDVAVSVHIDAPCQLLDQRFDTEFIKEEASIVEDACGADTRNQEGVDVTVPEKLNSDESLDGKHLPGETECSDVAAPRDDVQDNCSLPVHDVSVSDCMPLESGAFPSSDQVMEENQLDGSGYVKKDEIVASDQKDDISGLTPEKLVAEELKLDSSCSVEADLNSRNATLAEREHLEYHEADPNVSMDSTTIHMDYNYIRDHADIGADGIEHDTDFLNVDDDEVDEDYESDMPNEEKRLLDNTGWSARTRAVANYLQVLFEKESHPGKKDVSLDSLLAGKSRKEASRMFFETLVLKTKDYVQAEQEGPFCDIRIKPRGKLLKSEF